MSKTQQSHSLTVIVLGDTIPSPPKEPKNLPSFATLPYGLLPLIEVGPL